MQFNDTVNMKNLSMIRQLLLEAIRVIVLLILLLTVFPTASNSTYHSLFFHLSSNDTAAHHLLSLTRHPHVAGSEANLVAAAYVLQALSSASIPSHIVPYDTLLSYPVHRYLSLSSDRASPSVTFDLIQEIYPGDPYVDVAIEVMPTFHAYTHSGTAADQVVYANYGRVEDFAKLREAGVEVEGSVVLASYGGIFCGDIVRNVQLVGAKATIVPGIPSLPVSSREGELILRIVGGEVEADDWQGGEGALVYRLGPGQGFVNLTYLVSNKGIELRKWNEIFTIYWLIISQNH